MLANQHLTGFIEGDENVDGWPVGVGCPKTDLSDSIDSKFHVLVCVTGSVAALKLPLLVCQLLQIPGVSRT